MLRVLAAVFFSATALAQNVPDAAIARAVKSPYDLARYIETHVGLDWESLWKQLGAPNLTGAAPCRACSTEVVSLVNPAQAILIVQGEPHLFEIYIRYLQDAKGGWSFAGDYPAPIRNMEPMHQIMRLDGKPFLRVAVQAPNFGPVPNEQEAWFDLTRRDFDPVFSFPTDADQDVSPDWITRHVSGRARPNGAESIDLILSVDFDFFGTQLGAEDFIGRFERHGAEKEFAFKNAHVVAGESAISEEAFFELGNILVQPSVERMLVYAFAGLKELAAGKRTEAKEQLRVMLGKCGDTPEKRALLALLEK